MMDFKSYVYEIENSYLSPYGAQSRDTKGRDKAIEEDAYRTDYMRDRDRIIHSKAFRRLKHKTQVFVSPEGDHYRTRLTHTLEVAQIGRTIARALRLNEDLVEAIALGHDLGHTPFGHAGERILDSLSDDGFSHNEQSVRVVKYLENDGEGLNLTHEVIDGILEHRSSGHPHTLEGKVICYADRIAYLSHDIDDAIRAGILDTCDLPMRDTIGSTKSERIAYFVGDVVGNSYMRSDVSMTDEGEERLGVLRSFMFDKVYKNPVAMKSERIAMTVLGYLYGYYMSHVELLPPTYRARESIDGTSRIVTDYISSMTDTFAVSRYEELMRE